MKINRLLNKYLVLTLLILVLAAGPAAADNLNDALDKIVSDLTTELFMQLPADQDYKLAVADFLNQNNQKTKLSNFISEDLIIKLTNTGGSKIKVLERQRLNSILEEQDRMTSGVLKQETSEKIGELLGADSIIIGRYYSIKKEIHLMAKLVSIESGYIYSATKLVIDKDELIHSLLGENYIQRTMQ
ncbi:FlgO family outer membrane protein [Halanaerobium praevalens]|uniref:FlgO domain-containing protein n=1 Tax=Halanaerobium praevalens (strain ATCC 33744 / DSM 2228 / GSL) TaxID=572479 RepID=E3DQZ0_HALPG|nr:FlgO family outer membrane protein [Halanaerobium praevalens]ADO77979.1 hypothetical protein Hprae_1854 [Halanaerobium praevalens DSM 2228]